jgi:hypothetical protein
LPPRSPLPPPPRATPWTSPHNPISIAPFLTQQGRLPRLPCLSFCLRSTFPSLTTVRTSALRRLGRGGFTPPSCRASHLQLRHEPLASQASTGLSLISFFFSNVLSSSFQGNLPYLRSNTDPVRTVSLREQRDEGSRPPPLQN